jgi:PrtD family type I secretion system ABC transporter
MSRNSTPVQAAFAAARPALSTAFALSVFINLTLFASPLYSMQVYDRVLSSRNLGTLTMLTMIVTVFLVLYGILEYARAGVLQRGALRFNEILAKPLFELAMRAPLAGRSSAGTQALRDADTLRDALAGSTVSALFDVPWTPVFIGLCFMFHPAMGLVALVGALLIFVCALLTEYCTKAGSDEATKFGGEAARFSTGILRNAETVKGLGMAAALHDRWISIQNNLLMAQSSSSDRAAVLMAITKVVRMAVQAALIGVGAWLAINRQISPGIMTAAMMIMGRALAPVEHAVGNWKRITAARSAYARLTELFKALPAAPTATALPEPKGELKVEVLVVRPAKGGASILKEVSFAAPAGTAIAVIGPSGGGKSTLVKAIAGIWAPVGGAVRLDGAALSQWDAKQLGTAIGYLPQEVEFFTGTIAENIARLGTPDDAAVVKAAIAAGVHEAILKQPQGYETVLGDGEVVLSGGMRQRLGLARALYGNPCLVIMDEPNSNLDAEGEAALAEALKTMKAEKRTVVVVTHKPQLLAHVDNVLVLNAGKVQAYGKRDDVLAQMNGSKVAPMKPRVVSEGTAPAPELRQVRA